MKILFTYLKTLWRRGLGSQSSDVSLDCRLTVGSPSGLESSTLLKFVSVLVLVLTIGVGNVWGATETVTISAIASANSWANGTHYSGWTSSSGKFTFTASNSGQGLYYSSDNSWRGYKSKGSMVITAGSGITISSVTSSATASWSVASGGGSASFTPTATIKFTSFTITYTEAAAGPTITTSVSSLTEVGYSTADFSQQVKSFTVSGSSLTANVTVTAPTNYEVCKTSGGTYSSSVTFDKGSGTLATSTVYVRLQSGKTAGNYSGDVACSSSGATTKNVAVSGSIPFTVTWKANGTTHATTYVTYATGTGTALGSLPDDPDPSDYTCTPKAFYGWYDGVSYSNASVAPSIISTSTKITSDKTYNAVFADRSGSGDVTWDKVTSAPSDWSGDYVIVASDNANAMISDFHSGTSGEFKSASVTINAAGTQITSTPTDKMIWTFAKNGNNAQYSLKNKSTSTYAQITGTSSTNAALNASAQWFTIASTGTSGVWKVNSVSYSARCFAWYSSNSSFRTYANSTNNTGRLFKKSGDGYTWSNYATTCCTDPGLNYGTASVTKTYGEGVFTNTLTNSHSVAVTYSSSDPTVATVNGSGQVTILKAGSTTITASSAAQTVAAVSYCADEASYTLTVNKADISPSLSYSSTTLVIGNNSSSPTVGGNSGSGTVTYAITTESTSGVVTLNTSTGVVTAAKEGTATITATIPATTNYNGGSATANFTVTCGAPSSVDISGNYQFYPGETISLTATPTGGAGTPVTYQWKKDGVNIVGATSATYTKDDATVSDAGSYTCTVQYGSNCATTSDAFKLKCMQFYLKTSGGADISNHALTKVDATHATLSLSLTGGTTYKFRVTDGCGDWYGNTGEMTSSNCTNWAMDADADCRVTTSSKSATYTFNFDFSGGLLGSEMKVSVVYPSSDQASGKVIYWDNEVNKWNGSKLWYRIGKSTHNSNTQLSKVAGTANFYSVTTSQYDGFEYWHIANNVGQGTGNVYWTKDNSSSGLEITHAMGFEGAPITDATATVTPTTTHSTGGSSDNNNCEFYTYSITSGVKSYTVTSSATNCTVAMEKYNNDAGSSTTALASGGTVMPTQYVKVTVTPNTGYQFSSVAVTNGTTVTAAAAGTPGVYYITGNATVTATCTVKSCTVNFDKNSGTGGDASTTATYGSAMTTVTAPTRTGYTFDGYWDAETDNDGSGTQYYLANGTSARDWDKDVTAAQTLYAKWIAKSCTVTFDKNGGSGGDNNVTATYDATMTTITPPTRSGYTFDGYWDEETDNDGSGNKYYNANGTSAATWNKNTTSETTLYAKWIAKTDTYMTAMHEGASGWTAYASGHEESGAGYTIPNPGDVAKAGTGCEGIHYHFAGWVTEANKEAGTISGNIIPASGTTDATGTTFWAVWEKEKAGSGTGYTQTTTVSAGDVVVIAEIDDAASEKTGRELSGFSSTTTVYGLYSDFATTPAGTIEWTVEEGYNSTGVAFKNSSDEYLYLASAANSLSTSDSKSAQSSWSVTTDSERAKIVNNNWDTRIICWNGGSPRFACYTSKDHGDEVSGSTGKYYYYPIFYKKNTISYEDPKVECICSVNPSAGTAAVDAEGTFSASSIAVKATGASTGHTDCSYTDYGFVWSSSVSSAAELKLVEGTGAAAANCKKLQEGTSGEETSFTGSLEGSFTANTPIYFRSYVKNGKADGTYQYSSVVTITPRSVTFNLNGHGSSTPASQFVNNGSKATDPSYAESVTGYTFGGWYKEAGCSNAWNFASDVVSGESKTLYAKWTPISYSVRFNNNDDNYLGTATGSMSDQSFDYDEEKALTTNAFSLAGYDFAGWALTADGDVAYTDGASASNLSSTDGATVDLYAIWSPKNYDVTLAATDETSSVGSQTVTATYNAAMPTTKKGSGAVAAPSRTGYTFTGWEYSSTTYYDYNAGTSTLTSAHVWDIANSTTTLTPKWSINSYTLTWDLAGGTVSVAGTGAAEGATGTPSSSVVYNSAITVPTVTKAGYDFAGWDVTPASNMPASDVTYTATWTAKTLNSISLAEASVSVYVGEIKYVNVIFDPTDILSKAFGQVATPSYCQLNSYDSYNKLKITGGRAGADISVNRTETVSIKYTADETKTASISVTVKPLPTVTFVDLIHNKSDFANSGDGWTAGTGVLSSTVTTGVVSHAKKTPTHTDVTAPVGGNACETGHLHLMGWIRSDYSKVADYMNGTGEAPSVSDLTTAGAEYWFLPDADINTETYNGKTFYAVWAVEE